jgi:hypothetical protein
VKHAALLKVGALALGALGIGWLVLPSKAASPAPPDKLPGKLPQFDTRPRNAAEARARLGLLRSLRPDADWAADGYSRKSWLVVWQPDQGPWTYGDAELLANSAGGGASYKEIAAREAQLGIRIDLAAGPKRPIDEYGRPWHGVSGNPLGVMLQAAQIALPFIPGVGPAASAALATAIAWAKGESLKDAALKAARAAVPGGAAAQLAFDVGVAVAAGKPVDAAAKNALLAQVPGGQAAYQMGVDAYSRPQG